MKKVRLFLILVLLAGCVKRFEPDNTIPVDTNEINTDFMEMMYITSAVNSISRVKPTEIDFVSMVESRKDKPFLKRPDSVILIPTYLLQELNENRLIIRYTDVIKKRHGKNIWVIDFPECGDSPESVKILLRHLYLTYNIKGAILIGQWPIATWNCTLPNGWIRTGPLFTFYMDLDVDSFSLDTGDSVVANDMYSVYNRFNRSTEISHKNFSLVSGERFSYGPEIWVMMWRATDVGNPLRSEDYQKQKDQLSWFINKSLDFHLKHPPYYNLFGKMLIKDVLGCYHTDYAWNCDPNNPNSTAYRLRNILPDDGLYKTTGTGFKFVKKYFREQRHLILDVWTHSGSTAFWPDTNTVASCCNFGFHYYSKHNYGFVFTPIFGCSSGEFVYTERNHITNYAISLLMGNSIGLASVGTPWGIGFGSPYKWITYKSLIEYDISMGESLFMAETEMYYQTQLGLKEEHRPYYIEPHLFFGDPYLTFEDVK